MTIVSACYDSDLAPPWWFVLVNHLQDMNTNATPPFDLFGWTNFIFIPGGETVVWLTNHQLRIDFRLLAPPAPPPKPTIQLPIFHRDYRSHFGTVEPIYGPLDMDPCP